MIPEAAVEAAAKYLSLLMADPDGNYEMEARDLLEAAAPFIAAGAWDEGAHSGWLDDGAFEITNPYRPTP